jgi:long-chain acyl-CoA synthetase
MMLVQQFLEKTAKWLPDKTALVCGNKRLTYRDMDRQADQLAASLISIGVQRGDRTCILLDNSVESVISIFGILKAGGVFCVLSPTMRAKKLGYILKDAGARALITHVNKARVVKSAPFDADNVIDVIWCGNPGGGGADSLLPAAGSPRSRFWESLLDTGSHVSNENWPRSIDVDVATIIYTSGSTGEPKGVVSTHQNVTAAASTITQYLENTEQDIILNVLPLSFDYGLYQVLMTFLFGGTVILEKSFAYPYRVVERLVKERVTGFPIVPTMAAMLLQIQDLGGFDFRTLRYITNTAAALPVSYIERLQARFTHVKIYSMYGLTECQRVCYLPPEDLNAKPGSVGIPIPNSEVFIVDEKGDVRQLEIPQEKWLTFIRKERRWIQERSVSWSFGGQTSCRGIGTHRKRQTGSFGLDILSGIGCFTRGICSEWMRKGICTSYRERMI